MGPAATRVTPGPAGAPDAGLRDIKPLYDVPLGTPWWVWALVAAGVLVVGAAVAYWLWRRRQAIELEAPPEPADVIALRALGALSGRALDEAVARHRFCVELSTVLRTYVEARFGLNATDLTTEEIAARLAPVEALGLESRQELLTVLRTADGVKFAKAETGADELLRSLERGRGFVASTRPPVVPPAEAGAA